MRRSRRDRGRLYTILWFCVWVGSDRRKSLLLRNLRLAYVCRRRLQRLLAMDRRGTVAVVEKVPRGGKAGGWEVDSPPSYGMVCSLVLIGERACYCVIYDWHMCVDDDCSAC